MNQEKIVTRFAPSPTGILHIGGARTALFNWLFTRRHGGRFLLRIEDTDRSRSTDDAIDAIIDGLEWLELSHDGDIVYQSQREERHGEVARYLLETGHAYRCYASESEIAAERERRRRENSAVLFQSPWRDADPNDQPDKPFVVRLKTPLSGTVEVDDAVAGPVSWKAETIDDLILMRSDGTPTYMLAVVVDDHDMGISHVIRGNDHLGNCARQVLIYRACGWDLPNFAHIPLIHGPDGKKLSKRHGALGAAEYRREGFTPEAMRNYLARLGWSHGNDELFSTEEAISWFDLGSIGASPARFDLKKLENVSAYHLKNADDDELMRQLLDWLTEARGQSLSPDQHEVLARAVPVLKQNAKRLPDIVDRANCLLARPEPPSVDSVSAELDLTPEQISALSDIARGDIVSQAALERGVEDAIRDAAGRADLKPVKIFKLLRAVLAGTENRNSPSVGDLVRLLGEQECLARLDLFTRQIDLLNE